MLATITYILPTNIMHVLTVVRDLAWVGSPAFRAATSLHPEASQPGTTVASMCHRLKYFFVCLFVLFLY